MSLPRVGSLETFLSIPAEDERSRGGSLTPSIQPHRLSFNPLPESWNTAAVRDVGHAAQTIGAFEVSRWKRILQIVCAVLYCFLSAGIVFGYAALKPVLKTTGAYHDVCEGSDSCIEIRLNFMFTVAAVATNVAALPVGAILDYFGPRVCGIVGALFLAIGSLFMAFASRLRFDALVPGYLFLALGGPFTYIGSFQLSNAFPQRSGLILALLTGAFDASSALFLLFRIIFQKTGGAFGLESFFMVYLAVPAAIIIMQLTILPKQSYKTAGELMVGIETPGIDDPYTSGTDDQVDEETALLREAQRQEQREHNQNIAHEIEELLGPETAGGRAERDEATHNRSGIWGVMHNKSAWEQIRSHWFVLISLFTIVQMLRINWFVATIRAQYRHLFGSEAQAVAINDFFDAALPAGGVVAIPFVGAVLDRRSTLFVVVALVLGSTTTSVLGLFPSPWWTAAYANVCLFVVYRPFYYTAVSDYCAKVFGFRTFGTVYGAIICAAGLCNFAQSALDYLFEKTSAGDPFPVNMLLLVLGAVTGLALAGGVAVELEWRNRMKPAK